MPYFATKMIPWAESIVGQTVVRAYPRTAPDGLDILTVEFSNGNVFDLWISPNGTILPYFWSTQNIAPVPAPVKPAATSVAQAQTVAPAARPEPEEPDDVAEVFAELEPDEEPVPDATEVPPVQAKSAQLALPDPSVPLEERLKAATSLGEAMAILAQENAQSV